MPSRAGRTYSAAAPFSFQEGQLEKPRVKRPLISIVLILALLIAGALVLSKIRLPSLFGGGPNPETVASASLQAVREQARLTPFAARFVAVVTSTQSRFGLKAEKTMIMPGLVRYEIDLTKLQQQDLEWDPVARRLRVMLPPLEISPPQINLDELREYGSGGVLGALTDADDRIDAANRRRGQQELIRQAREPMLMRLARDAARRAVERSFLMPLKAAGIDAEVVAQFPDEKTEEPSFLDRSRRIEDVLKERQEQRR